MSVPTAIYTLRLRRLLTAGCGTTRRFVVTHQLLEATADINGGTASSENVEIDRSGHNRDQFSAIQRPSNGACAPLSIRPICAIGSASTPAACNGGSRHQTVRLGRALRGKCQQKYRQSSRLRTTDGPRSSWARPRTQL